MLRLFPNKIITALLVIALSPAVQAGATQARKTNLRYHTVKQGENLYSLLQKFRFSQADINKFIKKPRISNHFSLSIGQLYRTEKLPHGLQIILFENENDYCHVFTHKQGQASTYEFKKQNLRTEVHEGSGQVVGALITSLQKVVPDRFLPLRFIDAFILDFDLKKEVQRGAHFFLRYEKKFLGDKFIRYGAVLKAELEVSGKTHKRRLVPLLNGEVFLGNKLHRNRFLFAPVNKIHISSTFQRRRHHPILRKKIAHLGIDFAAPVGTPIYAARSGVVRKRGRNRAAGKYIVVEHDNGFTSYYNHLNKITKTLGVNQQVQAHTLLGEVGCTGYCTRPHLHFAVKKWGRFIDPIQMIKGYSARQSDELFQKTPHIQ